MTEIDPEQQLKRGLAGVLKNLLGVGAGAAITMTGVPLWGAGLFVLSIVCGQSSLEAWLSGKSDEELQKQMEFFLDRFEKHLEHAHSKQNRIQTGNLIQHFAKLKEESKGRHDQLSLLLQKIEDDRTQELQKFATNLSRENNDQLNSEMDEHQVMMADFFAMLERQNCNISDQIVTRLKELGNRIHDIHNTTTDTNRGVKEIQQSIDHRKGSSALSKAQLRAAIHSLNSSYRANVENELINDQKISRRETKLVIDKILKFECQGALVVAPGGYGKSCVMAQCASCLEENNISFLAIRMDLLNICQTANQLGKQLDLDCSPAAALALALIADGDLSVLIVDQLDAMSLVSGRKTALWNVFNDLCKEVIALPNMKMLLACRDFDLEHDHRLRKLGNSNSVLEKIPLGALSQKDIEESLSAVGLAAHKFSPQQLDILKVPFHLLLFLQGDPSQSFSSVSELFDRHWDRKQSAVQDHLDREVKWNDVIDKLVRVMSDSQSLFAPVIKLDDLKLDAEILVSEHVLVKSQDKKTYRFFHEAYFDYAYARRFCASDKSIHNFLIESDQHLFRRAQVRQILTYRREYDFAQYLQDVHELLDSDKIRFHLKSMIAKGFSRIENPTEKEWELIRPRLFEGDLFDTFLEHCITI